MVRAHAAHQVPQEGGQVEIIIHIRIPQEDVQVGALVPKGLPQGSAPRVLLCQGCSSFTDPGATRSLLQTHSAGILFPRLFQVPFGLRGVSPGQWCVAPGLTEGRPFTTTPLAPPWWSLPQSDHRPGGHLAGVATSGRAKGVLLPQSDHHHQGGQPPGWRPCCVVVWIVRGCLFVVCLSGRSLRPDKDQGMT